MPALLDESDRILGVAGLAHRRVQIDDEATSALVAFRCFGVRGDDRVVSGCHLYSDGVVAQVEDVSTLPECRGRGYARALVSAAIEPARAGGHEPVFVVADADDWPQELYRRMGFDAVGTVLPATRPQLLAPGIRRPPA